MKCSKYALVAVAVVALSLILVIGCKPASEEVEPPTQSLTEAQMDAIDAETTREWNADNPRAKVTLVRVRGKLPTFSVEFENVNDWPMREQGELAEPAHGDSAENAQSEAETTPESEEWVDGEYWDDSYYGEAYSASYDSADGFYSQGVRPGVDSKTETYYSSQVRYHERTGEWHTDDEGYWRDADGYYVVSSDDYAPDSVIETSKGHGKVYDSGSGSGNTDMYVNW